MSAPGGERPGQAGLGRQVAPKQDGSEAGPFSSFKSLDNTPSADWRAAHVNFWPPDFIKTCGSAKSGST